MDNPNSQVIGSELTALRFGRVIPFTKSPDFEKRLEDLYTMVREQVFDDRLRYSQDWSTTGLPGLANGIIRKASRVFDLMVLGMAGKDKPEDELRDNLMLAIYGYIYLRMVQDQESKNSRVKVVNIKRELDIHTKHLDEGESS